MLEHLVQQGQAQRALAVLRRPSTSPELHYKFAPALMAQVCWPSSAMSHALTCFAIWPGVHHKRLKLSVAPARRRW